MKRSLFTLLLLLGSLAGAANAQIYVRIGPPPPPREVVVVRPSPRHIWIPGYHRWDGRAYVWVPGAWVVPPSPRYHRWVPGHWKQSPRGYFWVEGHWR